MRSARIGKGPNSPLYDVAVIGAGPYGLSAGLHLKAKAISICIFGEPMEFWANKMPEGMLLRSPRVASHLSDPEKAFTLEAYEAATQKEPCALVALNTSMSFLVRRRKFIAAVYGHTRVCTKIGCRPIVNFSAMESMRG